MSHSNEIRIIAWIVLLIINDEVVRGQTGSTNAIVSKNGQVTLDCAVTQLAGTQWIRTTDGNSDYLLIASKCVIDGNNAAYYSTVLLSGNTICRLTIGNATMQQGGVYDCNPGSGGGYHRSLAIVYDSVASVVVYNQSGVVEGGQLNISCTINYNGSQSPAPSIRPSPYFTTSPEQSFTNATSYPSANVVTVVATVTVKKPKVPIFHCHTVFEIIGSATGYNLSAPGDNLTVGNTTMEFEVQSCRASVETSAMMSRSTTAKTTTSATTVSTPITNNDVMISAVSIALGVLQHLARG